MITNTDRQQGLTPWPRVQSDPQLAVHKPDLEELAGLGVTIEQEARGPGCPKLKA